MPSVEPGVFTEAVLLPGLRFAFARVENARGQRGMALEQHDRRTTKFIRAN